MSNEDLHLGKAGEELIKSYESLVLKAYVDTHDKEGNPIYAIGWGHAGAINGVKIVADQTITEEEAEKLEEIHDELPESAAFENPLGELFGEI